MAVLEWMEWMKRMEWMKWMERRSKPVVPELASSLR
jgi:hypothetical protein